MPDPCPACGYPADLAPGACCPECGAVAGSGGPVWVDARMADRAVRLLGWSLIAWLGLRGVGQSVDLLPRGENGSMGSGDGVAEWFTLAPRLAAAAAAWVLFSAWMKAGRVPRGWGLFARGVLQVWPLLLLLNYGPLGLPGALVTVAGSDLQSTMLTVLETTARLLTPVWLLVVQWIVVRPDGPCGLAYPGSLVAPTRWAGVIALAGGALSRLAAAVLSHPGPRSSLGPVFQSGPSFDLRSFAEDWPHVVAGVAGLVQLAGLGCLILLAVGRGEAPRGAGGGRGLA